MQESDQAITPDATTLSKKPSTTTTIRIDKGPDWQAIGTVLFIAALFAIVARLNSQPATSLMPVAALSATGCGLLVTAIRKIRTFQRPGLLDAAIAGFGVALFQFLAAITYPNVFQIFSIDIPQRNQFLATWLLVLACAVIFSLVGAALGHLAFAPFIPATKSQRSIATRVRAQHADDSNDTEDETDELEDENPQSKTFTKATDKAASIEQTHASWTPGNPAHTTTESKNAASENTLEKDIAVPVQSDNSRGGTTGESSPDDSEDEVAEAALSDDSDDSDAAAEESSVEETTVAASTPSFIQMIMSVFLLGLAPTIIAYVFSAGYDYTMGLFQLSTGPYPTLRILSTLLPWQVPIPITFTGTNEGLISVLLWRVPLFLGNPTSFDFQALEPVIFNGIALTLLLLLSQGQRIRALSNQTYTRINLPTYLALEALFGLVIILPANLWVQRGIQGLLQLQTIVIPIRTLELLDTTSFILNIVTAPLLCIIIGLILWSQRTRRTL